MCLIGCPRLYTHVCLRGSVEMKQRWGGVRGWLSRRERPGWIEDPHEEPCRGWRVYGKYGRWWKNDWRGWKSDFWESDGRRTSQTEHDTTLYNSPERWSLREGNVATTSTQHQCNQSSSASCAGSLVTPVQDFCSKQAEWAATGFSINIHAQLWWYDSFCCFK